MHNSDGPEISIRVSVSPSIHKFYSISNLSSSNILSEDLSNKGFHINPPSNTTRGGFIELFRTIAENTQSHKDLLLILFGMAGNIIQYLIEYQKSNLKSKDVSIEEDKTRAVIEIDGLSLTVDNKDLQNLSICVEKFYSYHPDAEKVFSSKSTVNITGILPTD